MRAVSQEAARRGCATNLPDVPALFSLNLASGIKSPILRGGMANIYLVGIGVAIWMMVRSVEDGRLDALGAAILVGWAIPFTLHSYVRAVCRVQVSASAIEIVTPVWTHRWPLHDLAVVEMRERTLVVGRYIVIRPRTRRFGRAFFVGGLGMNFDALTVQFNEAVAAARQPLSDLSARDRATGLDASDRTM